MLSKSELREKLTRLLEERDVADADDVAYDVVESLDEDGAFEDEEYDGD